MPVYRNIDDFTAGDTYTIIRNLDPLATGAPITDAWFTVKQNLTDNDAMALISSHITAAGSQYGYIINSGIGATQITFTVTPALSDTLTTQATYFYDICIVASQTGESYTVEEGKLFTTRYVRQLLA